MPGVIPIDIFHFNDFHRHLKALPNGGGGAARLTSVAHAARAASKHSVLTNGGDVAGDQSVLCSRTFEPIAAIFNAMGVDLFGPGNHEFEDPRGNYGSLRKGLLECLNAETLCANVTETRTGQPLPGTKPYSFRDFEGIKVAFVGVVTDHLENALFPTAGAGLRTIRMEEALREVVPRVRAEGADIVVVMAHEGLAGVQRVAESVPGIDLILAAHDHHATAHPLRVQRDDGSQTWLAEGGAYASSLGHVRLSVDAATHKIVGVEGAQIPVTSDVQPDPVVAAIVDKWRPLPHALRPDPKKRAHWVTVEREDLAAAMAARAIPSARAVGKLDGTIAENANTSGSGANIR